MEACATGSTLLDQLQAAKRQFAALNEQLVDAGTAPEKLAGMTF